MAQNTLDSVFLQNAPVSVFCLRRDCSVQGETECDIECDDVL